MNPGLFFFCCVLRSRVKTLALYSILFSPQHHDAGGRLPLLFNGHSCGQGDGERRDAGHLGMLREAQLYANEERRNRRDSQSRAIRLWVSGVSSLLQSCKTQVFSYVETRSREMWGHLASWRLLSVHMNKSKAHANSAFY